jgi:anti-sigma regulatory factor (Ser/Thr protein kinase)
MTSTHIRVEDPSAAGEARRVATSLADQIGLDEVLRGRAAIVATEIATNVQRHGGGGSLLLRGVDDVTGKYVEIVGIDKGRGIHDVDAALRDGFSTGGSAGTGLGAIARQSAQFDVWTAPNQGVVVLSRIGTAAELPFEIGVVSVPAPNETRCGDSYLVQFHPQERAAIRLSVIDGLGHGIGAHRAAEAAIESLQRTARRNLVETIEEAHGALRATRGAAVGMLEIDLVTRKAEFAGVGNISGTIIDSRGSTKSVVSTNGIVGHTLRKVQPFVYDWPADGVVVLYSDGITSSWNAATYPFVARKHPAVLAALIFRDNLRGRDDATVLVMHDRPLRGRA